MRTFGGTTADVVANIHTGLPAPGSALTVWTAKTGGTQITAVLDLTGTPYAGGVVTTDSDGAFGFKINSDTWPIVWVRDLNGRYWKCIADEITTGVASAYEQFPAVIAASNNAVAALNSITPVDAKGAGLVSDTNTATVASANVALLNSLLANGNVYIPAGVYWINDAVRIPSNRSLTGAGMGKTWLRMVNGAAFNTPAVTNDGNTFVAHTTPDVNIYIADLSINANRSNRAAGTSLNEGACAVQLACVEHALIERVHGTDGQHSFDISASMYRDDGPALYADGPSRWVTIRNCVGEFATGLTDDQFTTHHSQFIRIEDCVAINPTARVTYNNSHGFEVDDGSLDVQVVRCYSYGFNSGFQAKGHTVGPPARRVVFEDCVADTCRIGFDIQSLDPVTYNGSDGALPTGYAVSADVQVVRGKVRNLTDTLGDGSNLQAAVRLEGYTNVHIEDLLVQDSPQGFVRLNNHCSNVTIDGVVFENSWTAPQSWAAGYGAVTIDTLAGDNITVRNVEARYVTLANPIVSVASTTSKRIRIDGVRGTGSAGPAVKLAVYDVSWDVRNVYQSGFAADITVTSGSFAGNRTQQMTGRETYGTAAPTTGTWNRGDRCWNINPAAGGTPGWICTTAGTPGTWRAIANLAA